MQGRILEFSVQTNTGIISGNDGSRYYFGGSEWKATGIPARGMIVDFEKEENKAKNVYVAFGSSTTSTKNKLGPGLVFLLINTIGLAICWIFLFIPNIILWVIGFVEGIIYLTKSDEEFEQQYVVEKKQWF
jgi:hypothetical protein